MKAAGLLDLSLPTGFEVPDPSRAGEADEEDPIDDNDSPEFAQDFVGD
jgi:segregation and condensation protein B